MSRYRNVCFTAWSDPQDLASFLEQCQYVLVGVEYAPETNRKHFQGYCEFKAQLSLSKIKGLLGAETHIERRYGTQAQAIAYCKKGGEIYEHGEPRQQGQRNDLRSLIEYTREHTLIEVMEEYPSEYLRYHRGIKECKYLQATTRAGTEPRDVKTIFLYGPTGCGKTSLVYDTHPGLYKLPPFRINSTIWFDGYEGQLCLLIDDLIPSSFSVMFLLQVCDRYPLQVQIKGGMVWAQWTTVYITSNSPFAQLFQEQGMIRRIPPDRRFDMTLSTGSGLHEHT